jgi:hypothetical protein
VKAILRSVAIVTALAAAIAVPSTATASPRRGGAGHYGGNASIDCFGCGTSAGSAALQFTGVYSGYPAVLADATANFIANESADVTCVITGSASGTVTGVINVDFNWTRVGPLAVITTSGDINGVSLAAFAVTSPIGNPCGGPVTAIVQGVVAGT